MVDKGKVLSKYLQNICLFVIFYEYLATRKLELLRPFATNPTPMVLVGKLFISSQHSRKHLTEWPTRQRSQSGKKTKKKP